MKRIIISSQLMQPKCYCSIYMILWLFNHISIWDTSHAEAAAPECVSIHQHICEGASKILSLKRWNFADTSKSIKHFLLCVKIKTGLFN